MVLGLTYTAYAELGLKQDVETSDCQSNLAAMTLVGGSRGSRGAGRGSGSDARMHARTHDNFAASQADSPLELLKSKSTERE